VPAIRAKNVPEEKNVSIEWEQDSVGSKLNAVNSKHQAHSNIRIHHCPKLSQSAWTVDATTRKIAVAMQI